jgi:hypothetical protein
MAHAANTVAHFITTIVPWDSFWKVLAVIEIFEELHAHNSEDIQHDDQDKRQLAQSTQGISYDSQQVIHGWPHLS